MRPALHAEWTKMRTVASPLWLLLGTIAATAALSAAASSPPGFGKLYCRRRHYGLQVRIGGTPTPACRARANVVTFRG